MTTIFRSYDGYDCEFEGRDYEGDDPSVGLQGGFCYWELLGATRPDGSELSDVELRWLSDWIVQWDEPFGDTIISDLNVAHDEEDDYDYDPPDDWNRHEGYEPK